MPLSRSMLSNPLPRRYKLQNIGEAIMIRLHVAVTLAAVALPCLAFAADAGRYTLTSTEVAEGKNMATEQILNGFGCTGGNVSPTLRWTAPPAGTKSLTLQVYDPDAPTGSGWWHWVV